ncbi:MAG: hypothetical protein ACO0C9_03680 [Candidatus Methanosuratincola verstraetei]|jgi:hypothetical protein
MKNRILYLYILISCTFIFFIYESTFLPQKLPTYVFYLIAILLSLSIVLFAFFSKNIIGYVLTISFISFLIKEAFLSVVPPSIISLYLDNYVIYQVANGIATYSRIPPIDYYSNAAIFVAKQPVAPVFSVIFSGITGVPLELSLRHLGCVIGGLIIPIVICLLYNPLEKQFGYRSFKFSHLSLLFSPWIVFFLIWGHYSIYSITYFAIMSFIILRYLIIERRIGVGCIILWSIASIAISFAHFYLSVIALAIFGLTLFCFIVLLYGANYTRRFFNLLCIYSINLIIYVLFFFEETINSILFSLTLLFEAIVIGDPSRGINFYFAGGGIEVPFYVRFLRWAGAISWALLTAFSFILLLRKYRNSRKFLAYIMYLSVGTIGFITALPYILDPKYGTDLFDRYLYFFGLMCAAPFVGFISKHFSGKLKKVIYFIFLTLIINFGITMSPVDFQSWNYPIRGGEDIRLYPSEWAAAGTFTLNYADSLSSACGLRQGLSKIGYFSRINYYEIQPSASNQVVFIPPDEWDELKNYWTDCCFLRKSITKYEEVPGYVVQNSTFDELISSVKIVYTCTDVFIIYYRN